MRTAALPFLLVLLIALQPAIGQQYFFDAYDVKDGLAQSNVYKTFQDKDGFVWLGTEVGASRFDGLNFENFNESDGLAPNGVRSIFQDQFGSIWLGHTGGGLTRFKDNQFESFTPDSITGDITSIFEANGKLWLSTVGTGLIRISNYNETKEIVHLEYLSSNQGISNRVFGANCLTDSSLLFITDVGIKTYKSDLDTFVSIKLEGLPSYFQATNLFEDQAGNLWIGTFNGGLYEYDKAEKKFNVYDTRDGLAHNFISAVTQDSKGIIWVGTWGGGITQIKNGELRTFNKSNGLSDLKIRSLFPDREGNLLIGTNESGLLIYKGDQFVSLTKDQGLIDDQVWAIEQDNDSNIWLATNAGISVYQFVNESKNIITTYSSSNGLLGNQVRNLKKDKNGNIWLGTWGNGVMRFDFGSKEFNDPTMVNLMISQGNVTALETNNYNQIWIGTTDGLIYHDIETDVIERLSEPSGLAGRDISSLFCDNSGTIWVGARGKGITTISGIDFKILELEKHAFTPTSITQDNEGIVWVGTEGQGLLGIKDEKIVKSIGVKEGLLADYITLVNIDKKGNLWIGTHLGLNRYNPQTEELKTFTEKNGFSGIEAKRNATFVDASGDIWFGTVHGAIKANADFEEIESVPNKTNIKRLSVLFEEVNHTQKAEYLYNENYMTFDFIGVNLTVPNKVKYSYQLKGLLDEWSPPSPEKKVTFSNLPPGEFEFKVKSVNQDGNWGTESASYSFVIAPPFWQTWWFYLITSASIIGAVIFYIRSREKKLIKDKEVLEQKVTERTAEVVEQKEIIEEKNQEIMDSINYAQGIQDTILPSEELQNELFPESFVIFQPKDIVSGDFYWMGQHNDQSYFSAIDCTGHGVPGAFVSMIGGNGLHSTLTEFQLESPAEILDKVSEIVETAFKGRKDGMDAGLVMLDYKQNKVAFAGANNPLYIISKSDQITVEKDGKNPTGYEPVQSDENGVHLFEIKANKQPIGAFEGRVPFTNYSFELKKGDSLYVFTDGFPDQFGGPKGKKFKYKPFKKLLLENCNDTLENQKQILETAISEWMGNEHEQIDDICIVGVRV